MSDPKWLSLSNHLSRWPRADGGYVVTRNDKLVTTGTRLEQVMHELPNSTLYATIYEGEWKVPAAFDKLARLVVPHGGPVILGLDIEVELDEI